jgi:hypothetical protein
VVFTGAVEGERLERGWVGVVVVGGLDWIGLVETDGIYNSGHGLQQNLHENTSSKIKDSEDSKEEVWMWR